MSMKKYNEEMFKFTDLVSQDTYQEITEEQRYTITMRDFLQMPALDYHKLAKEDPFIRALMN